MRTWLRDKRTEKGFTMAQMGEGLGISESYYCAIEAGTRQVKMDMSIAAGISNILGVSLKTIASYETHPHKAG